MTKTNYRLLVVASIVLPILGAILDSVLGLIPADLKEMYDQHLTNAMATPMGLVVAGLLFVFLLLSVVTLYGQLRFRRWAPKFAVWFAVAGLVVVVFSGPVLMSGLYYVLICVGCALWGLALYLPFFSSDVREMFWPTQK